MDARLQKAQRLFREIEDLKQSGTPPALLFKLREMAQLREERALELLDMDNPDGWIDLFTAITAWGHAGARSEAGRLVSCGRQYAAALTDGRQGIEDELVELEQWLNSLPSAAADSARRDVLPVLGE
jgi:hypothetical protein